MIFIAQEIENTHKHVVVFYIVFYLFCFFYAITEIWHATSDKYSNWKYKNVV